MALPWSCILGQLALVLVEDKESMGDEPLFFDAWTALATKLTVTPPDGDFKPSFKYEPEEMNICWYGFDEADGHYSYEDLENAWMDELKERDYARASQD